MTLYIILAIYCGVAYTLGGIMWAFGGRTDRAGHLLILLFAPISIPLSLIYEMFRR